MPVYQLTDKLWFPPTAEAEPDGLLAFGGDLSEDRLLSAYQKGIFPWFDEQNPILWWSPNPRFVLFPEKIKISKSMRPYLNQEKFSISYNTCFEDVLLQCAKIIRKDQDGTWITNDMFEAYTRLHKSGVAHSVEVWQNEQLVGGLYGLHIGKVFFGESMFSSVSNASKYGFIKMAQKLHNERKCTLIDCQVHTDHLESLGAEMIDRSTFEAILEKEING